MLLDLNILLKQMDLMIRLTVHNKLVKMESQSQHILLIALKIILELPVLQRDVLQMNIIVVSQLQLIAHQLKLT